MNETNSLTNESISIENSFSGPNDLMFEKKIIDKAELNFEILICFDMISCNTSIIY